MLFDICYSSRYYFILYEVDAPIKQRYLRFKEKYGNQKSVGIEEFVELDDMVSVMLMLGVN